MSDFERQLRDLLNAHSQENASNTPDFILAQYLAGCLAAFNTATQQRETWYGRDARPGAPIAKPAAIPIYMALVADCSPTRRKQAAAEALDRIKDDE